MGLVALRCSKCGKIKTTDKRNFWEGFQLHKNRPICNDCYKKKEK